MSVIVEGTTVQVTGSFFDLNGDPADTTAVLVIEKPDGTVVDHNAPTQVGTGEYAVQFIAEPGLYRWRWEGSGVLVAASEGFFYVRETAIG